MTPVEATAAAGSAAQKIRTLNHATMPGAAELDVSDVYELLAELALMSSRLPQLLRQLEDILDALVENDQVVIVDGDQQGDPIAAAAIVGHWLTAAAGTAGELAYRVDQAQQTLTWAAPADH